MATVKMTKETDDGVYTADVHPDEVENYKSGGWRENGEIVEASIMDADSPEPKKRGRQKK